MIKLSDYVINFLVEKGIRDIFLVSGGGIMHLIDSVGRNKKIKYISNYHEQASAICAESYARMTNHISACLVTTGPGGTNAITGVAGAYLDSIPMIVISGQVRREIIADYKKLRQLGPQEINIIDIVKPITKYAETVMDPQKIRYHLEKAYFLAITGKPGPIWLNIPLDVQGSYINENKLKLFMPPAKRETASDVRKKAIQTIKMLQKAKRPVMILGNGVRLAHGEDLIDKLVNKLNIPILLPFNGLDLIPYSHPLLAGKFGPVGQRRGNFALQNSDLILSIGASLNISSTGFNFKGFAPKATKIMVNIDKEELTKNTLKIDLAIESDAKEFIVELLCQMENYKLKPVKQWIDTMKYWRKKYPDIIPEFFKDKKHVNSYVLFDKLSDLLTNHDTVVTCNSLDAIGLYQALRVKKEQRAYTNANLGPMGWCLPSAIGACVGNKRKRTILVTGDGSIQFNIQELNTISYYKLPIKIFILNNEGYESIRSTQTNYFSSRFVGADKRSGVVNPDFAQLAQAYHMDYEIIHNNNELTPKLKKVLTTSSPTICEINLSPTQGRNPKTASFKRPDGTLESKPLEDMYPFLPREEIQKNMHLFDKGKV